MDYWKGSSAPNETLALRMVECIAIADQQGLAVVSAHLVTALVALNHDAVPRQVRPAIAANELN